LSIPAGADDATVEALKPWIRRVLQTLFSDAVSPLVNVNFPRAPRGLVWTRAEVRHYDGAIVPVQHPSGREMFWFTVKPLEGAEEGTDRWAMEQGWVSLTPLRLDLTDQARLAEALARHPLDEAIAALSADRASAPDSARAVREAEAQASIDRAVVESNNAQVSPDPKQR
jgi:5'-nucleotidase